MRQMLSTGQQNNASTGASTGACPAVAAGFSPTSGNTPFHRHWAEWCSHIQVTLPEASGHLDGFIQPGLAQHLSCLTWAGLARAPGALVLPGPTGLCEEKCNEALKWPAGSQSSRAWWLQQCRSDKNCTDTVLLPVWWIQQDRSASACFGLQWELQAMKLIYETLSSTGHLSCHHSSCDTESAKTT